MKRSYCLNCEGCDSRFIQGYCSKCYPLHLKIEKIGKGILPKILQSINLSYYDEEDRNIFLEAAKKSYTSQIKRRLEIIKDSRVLKDYVSEHDLEYRINMTLNILDGKSLGKINDMLAHYFNDGKTRARVYQLFSQIQLLKPFQLNYWQIYDARKKK